MPRKAIDGDRCRADNIGHTFRTISTAGRSRVMATKIGIIGDGNVGGALARGLERAGHEVRSVGKDKEAIR